MSNIIKIRKIAQSLFDAHAAKSKFQNLSSELKPQSIAEAYEIQKALNSLWKESGRGPISGYKIALTSKAIQDLVGVDKPVGAAIFASTVHQSPATIFVDNFVRLGLEFELAFTISKDVPEKVVYDANSISDFVDSAMPAFELIEDRAADYSNLDPMSLIADNAWCGGIVIGVASKKWRQLDLATNPVNLVYNDSKIQNATTGEAMGNPLNSLAWLATLLGDQERPLKAGDMVMSGSTLATKFVKRGDYANYTIQGMGSVEVTIQ